MTCHLPPVIRTKIDLIDRILYLERELEERRFIGAQMSNVMFNLAQKTGTPGADLFDSLRRQWDAITRCPSTRIAPIQAPTRRQNATTKARQKPAR
jgi:hypothetical protein